MELEGRARASGAQAGCLITSASARRSALSQRYLRPLPDAYTYFITALDALGLVLHARGLGHRRLGTAMRHEREQQEISRRELAAHLKVSRTTLAALERNRSVRISIVDRYALALRIRVVVSPRPHSSGRS